MTLVLKEDPPRRLKNLYIDTENMKEIMNTNGIQSDWIQERSLWSELQSTWKGEEWQTCDNQNSYVMVFKFHERRNFLIKTSGRKVRGDC